MSSTKQQSQAKLENLPHSLESEYTVLGAILSGETQFVKMLTPAHFHEKLCSDIYAAMQRVDSEDRNIDIIEIYNEMDRNEYLRNVGGSVFLAELCTKVVAPTMGDSSVRVLQEKYAKRKTIEAARKLKEFADGVEDIRAVPKMMSDAARSLTEILPRPQDIDKAALIKNLQTTTNKFPTGFPQMDLLLEGGMEAGVFLIAARPSVGKSAMASTMMANFLKAGTPISMISLEMSEKQVMTRMLCAYFEVIPTEAIENAEQYVNRIETPYWISDNSDISSILQEIYTSPSKIVIIDYFGLITSKDDENSVQKMENISKAIKHAAMEANKPVVLLWQLNRDVEKDKVNRQPRLSDLYGGGEKDPDQISFLHDPNAKEEFGAEAMQIKDAMAVKNPVNELQWIVGKNRHGAKGFMRLRFEQKKSLMTEDLTPYVPPKAKEVKPSAFWKKSEGTPFDRD